MLLNIKCNKKVTKNYDMAFFSYKIEIVGNLLWHKSEKHFRLLENNQLRLGNGPPSYWTSY